MVHRSHPFHHLLQSNGGSLAEDDDSDDSSFELEVIKVNHSENIMKELGT